MKAVMTEARTCASTVGVAALAPAAASRRVCWISWPQRICSVRRSVGVHSAPSGRRAPGVAGHRLRAFSRLVLGLAFVQSLLGALVAGNDAGLVYNDWPLMNGALLPDAYWGKSLWSTLAHSQGAVQLHHRLVAYALFAAALGLAFMARRSRHLPGEARMLAFTLAGIVTLQAGLGIWTLMAHVPVSLGVLHQAGAAVLLGAAAMLAWRVRRV